MEEKVLIESKHGIITKILPFILIAIGFIVFAMIWPFGWAREESLNYVLTSMLPYYGSMTILPAVVIAIIVFLATARCSMTITDKRVYGKAVFGKRVDLPMDSISAVSTSALKGISVSTSSGIISFFDISNQEEMHKVLSKLLIERQNNTKKTAVSEAVASSSADELKKYKDLLDNGVISQEEFDAKKKQLLGL